MTITHRRIKVPPHGMILLSLVFYSESFSTYHHVASIQRRRLSGSRNHEKFRTVTRLSAPKTASNFDRDDNSDGGMDESERDVTIENPAALATRDVDNDDALDVDDIATIMPSKSSERKSGYESFVSVIDTFSLLKEALYERIRQVLADIITIIKRSVAKTESWVRDDAVGQLAVSALSLILFFAGVAAFAAWNIEILGGKKWSGPSQVIVPTVRSPDLSSSRARSGVTFQKPKWNFPGVRTSYNDESTEKTADNEPVISH